TACAIENVGEKPVTSIRTGEGSAGGSPSPACSGGGGVEPTGISWRTGASIPCVYTITVLGVTSDANVVEIPRLTTSWGWLPGSLVPTTMNSRAGGIAIGLGQM